MSNLGSTLPPSSSNNSPEAARTGTGLLRRLQLLFYWLGGLSLIGLLLLAVLWFNGTLENRFQLWVQKKVIAKLIHDLQPKVPFVMETVEVDAPWSQLKDGKIAALRLVLKYPKVTQPGSPEWRLRALGALQIHQSPGSQWKIQYDPVLTLETRPNRPSSPFPLRISAQLTSTFSELKSLELQSEAEGFQWKEFGVDLEKFKLDSDWKASDPNFNFHFTAEAATWNQKVQSEPRTIHSEKIDFKIQSPLFLPVSGKPFGIGPKIQTQFSSSTLEILWGETYLDFPIREFPLRAALEIASPTTFEIQKLSLDFPTLQMLGRKEGDRIGVQWKSGPMAIEKIQAQFGALLPKPLAQLQVRQGLVKTHGQAEFSKGFKTLRTASGRVSGEKIWILFREASSEIKKASFELPFNFRAAAPANDLKITQGMLQVEEAYFKHFKGRLEKTRFSFLSAPKAAASYEFKTDSAVPLTIEGVPLIAGQLTGHLDSQGFQIQVPLAVQKVELAQITRGFCSKRKIPPVQISFDFKPASFSNGDIEPIGQVRVDLFGGKILVDDIAFFDLGSEVPQSDFSATWSDIRLEDFGSHQGFGEMAGKVQGYAKDVVFQSWLPTHYDFRFEVKPDRGADVVFSPEAMKNVIKLFAGEDIDHLPGVANWLAFGWPSRLFGGYDIDYFGISAFSSEGAILLETLDPPEIYARERQHFILYGKRFKMPLNSARYPLVVDATSMSNFVRHMIKQFDTIAKEKEKKENPDEENESCLPPGLAGSATQ